MLIRLSIQVFQIFSEKPSFTIDREYWLMIWDRVEQHAQRYGCTFVKVQQKLKFWCFLVSYLINCWVSIKILMRIQICIVCRENIFLFGNYRMNEWWVMMYLRNPSHRQKFAIFFHPTNHHIVLNIIKWGSLDCLTNPFERIKKYLFGQEILVNFRYIFFWLEFSVSKKF